MKRKLYVILAVLDMVFFCAGATLLICIPTVWRLVSLGVAIVWIALFLSAITIMAMLDVLIGRYDDER